MASSRGKWDKDVKDRTRTPSPTPAPPRRRGEGDLPPAKRPAGSAGSSSEMDTNALLRRIVDNTDNLIQDPP